MTTTQRRRRQVALAGFFAIAGFFLLTEHRAHLLGWWPFLFLLACPLLHVLGHGRHGGHAEDSPVDVSAGGDDAEAASAHVGHRRGNVRTL